MLINLITVFIFIALPLTSSSSPFSDFSPSFGSFRFVFVFQYPVGANIYQKGMKN